MILLLALLALLMIGVPLFVVLGTAALVAFSVYVAGYDTFLELDLVARKMTDLTGQPVFLAIPFFVVSGAIMSAGGISRRLVELAEALVGWMRGGLAIASIGACVIFAAISGSSPVTLIAIGGLMFPAMVKAGYSERFALGLVTTAGSLGMLIPPSVPMLIYAISVSGTAAVSPSDLFMAGLGPALLISGMLAVYAYFFSGNVAAGRDFDFARLRKAFREGVWALMLPGIILGGIYSGVFTPTEAAAVSVVYALFAEFVIHREMKVADLPKVVLDSVQTMGALVMIIVLSLGLNQFMVEQELGQRGLEYLKSMGFGPIGFLIAMNIFLLLIGMVMDCISAIVLFTPLIVPAAVGLGLDPLHVGIIFIVNMEIGYMMPPIAANIFVSASLFKKSFGFVTRAVMPTVAILVLGLLTITYVPTLATGPVYALRGQGFVRPVVANPPAWLDEDGPALAADDASPKPAGGVMTLDEMMRRARAGEADDEAAQPAPEGRVLSMDELMKKARAQEAEATDSPEPEEQKPSRVMTMQELMQKARANQAEE